MFVIVKKKNSGLLFTYEHFIVTGRQAKLPSLIDMDINWNAIFALGSSGIAQSKMFNLKTLKLNYQHSH